MKKCKINQPLPAALLLIASTSAYHQSFPQLNFVAGFLQGLGIALLLKYLWNQRKQQGQTTNTTEA
ncbi:hypothetical protein LJC61_00080 [Ruminococcaceae bacterium OttesenSCG-928-A16]|nr:hypothetical protein [Ruminococcaceae bacterium OttesenSCG-928-A16]